MVFLLNNSTKYTIFNLRHTLILIYYSVFIYDFIYLSMCYLFLRSWQILFYMIYIKNFFLLCLRKYKLIIFYMYDIQNTILINETKKDIANPYQ